MERLELDPSTGTAPRQQPETAAWERVMELDRPYTSPSGRDYAVSVDGLPREDGTWAGRICFTAGGDLRATPQETSQPSRDALLYWATGLEPVFLDGAFGRATV